MLHHYMLPKFQFLHKFLEENFGINLSLSVSRSHFFCSSWPVRFLDCNILTNIVTSSPPSFPNHLDASSVQSLFHGSTSDMHHYGKEKRLSSVWKIYIRIPRKSNFNVGCLTVRNAPVIKAVATFELKSAVYSKGGLMKDYDVQSESNSNDQGVQYTSDDSSEMDERERLRRFRISKANKGNVPWNKGKKHSAETIQRIRERTKLAMQHPKVKMKLMNLGHAQSEETRMKIGVGVRSGWERRRKRLMLQETCYFEWQNMIAEASRKGFVREDELQWDSYGILEKQLKKEWLESIERRKRTPRQKGSSRAPKSPEQRKKISEAISAKWADPGYRERVCAALSKYHGTPVGVERKPRKKATGEISSLKRSQGKRKATGKDMIAGTQEGSPGKVPPRKGRNAVPSFKDPLADSKLDMIKKLREKRAAMETKKSEAMERAKLLIAEAEKAAEALEVAALKNPLARASLLEARKLIAVATQSIKSIETGQLASGIIGSDSDTSSSRSKNLSFGDPDDANSGTISNNEVNGTHTLSPNDCEEFDLDKFLLKKFLSGPEHAPMIQSAERTPTRVHDHLLPSTQLDFPVSHSSLCNSHVAAVNGVANGDKTGATMWRQSMSSSAASRPKKVWVRGRLVEVTDD